MEISKKTQELIKQSGLTMTKCLHYNCILPLIKCIERRYECQNPLSKCRTCEEIKKE